MRNIMILLSCVFTLCVCTAFVGEAVDPPDSKVVVTSVTADSTPVVADLVPDKGSTGFYEISNTGYVDFGDYAVTGVQYRVDPECDIARSCSYWLINKTTFYENSAANNFGLVTSTMPIGIGKAPPLHWSSVNLT